MKILVTGAAGFIGFHTAKALLNAGHTIVGIDNINDYYCTSLKYARLANNGIDTRQLEYGKLVQSTTYNNFFFIQCDITDREILPEIFSKWGFEKVINLAAQVGIRYSLVNPFSYIESNIVGFCNILECCTKHNVSHLIYASSSSVYGNNKEVPFSEKDRVDNPISLYAATKKSNEILAECYNQIYNIPITGLRFFTVYGPWGRPDMAPLLFTLSIDNHQPIKIFNNGDMLRDFTYIDDIVDGIKRVVLHNNPPDTHKIYNIGCAQPIKLMSFIQTLEGELNCEAQKIMMPMQPGDVYQTFADTSALEHDLGYKPHTTLKDGIREMVKWYNTHKNLFQNSK